MFTDRHGNALTGATPSAKVHYDDAVAAFNIYTGDPVALAEAAIAEAPAFTMAHILQACLLATATEPAAAEAARAIAAHARTLETNDRERSLLAALDPLLANNWTVASVSLDQHNMRHPLDLVGLQVGHLTDFFRGNARNLRDRIARALPFWSEDLPGYSFVLGMYAFGLEESGDYARAEAYGREAVAREPLDCWAHHAVAHVMEMQGRSADGIGWMQTREPHWSTGGNFMRIHNWWHKAVFHLDQDQAADAVAIYDREVRKDKSATAADLIDASALLWRLHLAGCDVGDRWTEVADCWEAHADGTLYPFNDWHAAMAYLGAGRLGSVERLLAHYRTADASSETARWARETGLPLIEGFAAFWRGAHEEAVAKLYPARYIANSFGGSHAQRDVIDLTLAEAALRGGLSAAAAALANERLAAKPHSPANRALRSRSRTLAKTTPLAA